MPPWTDANAIRRVSTAKDDSAVESSLHKDAAAQLLDSGRETSTRRKPSSKSNQPVARFNSEDHRLLSLVPTASDEHQVPTPIRPGSSTNQSAFRWPLTTLLICFIAWKIILLTIAVASPGPSYDTSTKILFAEPRSGYTSNPTPLQSIATTNSAADALDPLDLAWYVDSRGDRQPYGYLETIGLQAVDPLHFGLNELSARLALRLVKWDAIYFVSIGKRGRLFEQEWAFGWGWGRLVQFLSERYHFFDDPLFNVAYVGILISNSSHLLSVIVLYYITLAVAPPSSQQKRTRLAFITAALHIVSPASFFLVAPYAEALFSLLSFMGHLLFAKSTTDDPSRTISHDFWLLLSGVFFGLSSLIRPNGVINGLIPFASMLLQLLRFPNLHWRKLLSTIISGLFIGMGMLYPQYLAYLEFCVNNDHGIDDGVPMVESPVWCRFTLPSITSHVQSRYWNVGFLRYWVPSNIGLFAIAAPTLGLLGASGFDALRGRLYSQHLSSDSSDSDDSVNDTTKSPLRLRNRALLSRKNTTHHRRRRPGLLRTVSNTITSIWKRVTDDSSPTLAFIPAVFALQQILLAFLALTTFHVQIITRLASGSPLWYLWLGGLVADNAPVEAGDRASSEGLSGESADEGAGGDGEVGARGYTTSISEQFVRYMVCYGLVQGALFAAFLPPA